MDLARTGSFRVRSKNADRATKNLKEQLRRRVASKTYSALQQFEDKLARTQVTEADVDDLPIDADSTKLRKTMSTWDGAASLKDTRLTRSTTLPGVMDSTMERQEKEPCARRPPSPLSLYDYGAISGKPRSLYGQQRVARERDLRPKNRQTSCGFYFPGPQMRQGPYGFSMLDPIHMVPTSWQIPKAPPERWPEDASDARPATLDWLDRKRCKEDAVVIPDAVRCNGAHERRTLAVFKCLDRHRDDMVLERRRFENGVYEGRWRLPGRDPTLDRNAPIADEDDEKEIDTDWVGLGEDELSDARRLASSILFGLQAALAKNRAKLSHLFKGVDYTSPGVLEPAEFLRGLIRLGIVQSDEVTPAAVAEAMSEIDHNFNGRVEFPTLEKAIQAARLARKKLAEAEQLHRKQQHKIIAQSYSESLPVEVIKVDRDSRSLVIFQRSFEKFRKQQRDLLVQHNEQPQPL